MGFTAEDGLKNLSYANEIRLKRAQIKRDLRTKRIHIRDVIFDPPEEIKNATLYEMLACVGRGPTKRRWGRGALKIIHNEKLNCTEFTKVGNLTARQRQILNYILPRK